MSLIRAIGCMIGAAFGDSLGAAVEFLPLSEIRKRYGYGGITACDSFYGLPPGVITDDTQMAMATALGLMEVLKTIPATEDKIIREVWMAYLEWLQTQSDPKQNRAPGTTCLSALRSGKPGTIDQPLNHSAGCGAIMRAHPVGIAFACQPDLAFRFGMVTGAITHGHPNGYVPAGVFASLVAFLLQGKKLPEAVELVLRQVSNLTLHQRQGTQEAIETAMLASLDSDPGITIDTSIKCTGSRGGGWQGQDALAIALYAIRCAPADSIEAVRIAVNHSGDSDSTGSIAGAIMGAMYGSDAFENHLIRTRVSLEQHRLLTELGQRLYILGKQMEIKNHVQV